MRMDGPWHMAGWQLTVDWWGVHFVHVKKGTRVSNHKSGMWLSDDRQSSMIFTCAPSTSVTRCDRPPDDLGNHCEVSWENAGRHRTGCEAGWWFSQVFFHQFMWCSYQQPSRSNNLFTICFKNMSLLNKVAMQSTTNTNYIKRLKDSHLALSCALLCTSSP